jgi:pimeloyl-ACP methyl ester carboxylesterase
MEILNTIVHKKGITMETRLINIGDLQLEVCTKGEDGPVVVIETGMGCSFYEWDMVSQKISEKAKVLMYHREGYGNSTLSQEPCTSSRIVENLRLLLEKEKINEPVILVGHSFGGLCVQHFARLYPHKVLGVVLVDSSPMQMYKIEDLKRKLPSIQAIFPTYKTLDRMKKFSNMSEEEILKQVNATDLSIKEFLIKPNLYKANASELENMFSSGRKIEALGDFPNIPLKVMARDREVAANSLIKAGIDEEEARVFEDLIQELSREVAGHSTKGKFISVKNSGHCIYIDCPNIVIDVIEEIISEV